jgi:tRNA(Ile)-lysidine synthase
MDALEKKVRKFIQNNSLLEEGDRVLVGYSGGPDSTFLLLMLRNFWKDCAAIYVNHGLRGEESDKEENFVRKFCAERGIPLFVERVEWKTKPSNLEENARKRRYRHFEKASREHGFSHVALAHHSDDVAETFLLRLIRGSGPAGLEGIRPKRGIYIRPLLECDRSEIMEYLKNRQIPYFTDTSNVDVSLSRNLIRAEMIPYIESRLNPSFRKTLVETSGWIREQNELLSELLEPYVARIFEKKREFSIRKTELVRLSEPLRKAVLRTVVLKADPNLRPSSGLLKSLLRASEGVETLELPGFLVVKSTEDSIRFSRKAGRVGYFEVDVTGPGGYAFPPASVLLNFSTAQSTEIQARDDVAFLDSERASFPLYVRNWKKGDSFQPLGMKGHKKISDFLIDRKIPRNERKQIPLVFKNDDLIWVAGYQIHQEYRVTDQTRKVLKIELVKSVQK